MNLDAERDALHRLQDANRPNRLPSQAQARARLKIKRKLRAAGVPFDVNLDNAGLIRLIRGIRRWNVNHPTQ